MVSVQGNGMYQKGQLFELLNVLSSGQMQGYVDILNNFDIYLEEIIKWFFEVYLKMNLVRMVLFVLCRRRVTAFLVSMSVWLRLWTE